MRTYVVINCAATVPTQADSRMKKAQDVLKFCPCSSTWLNAHMYDTLNYCFAFKYGVSRSGRFSTLWSERDNVMNDQQVHGNARSSKESN